MSATVKWILNVYELPFDHLLIQDGDANKILILQTETLKVLREFSFKDAIIVDVKPLFEGLCLFLIEYCDKDYFDYKEIDYELHLYDPQTFTF